MVWINNDGLRVRFGNEEAVETKIGEYGNFDPGSVHLVELRLDTTSLGTLGKTVWTACRFPGANAETCFIKRAEIFVETGIDSAGEGLTLSIGFDNADGTVLNATGIDATVAEAAMATANTTIVCDGALVGTRLTNTQPLYLTTTVGTEIATSGEGWVRIWYFLENL